MTGSTRSSHDLDPRRRRALFRAWRRGMKETDLLLGPFADAYIASLADHDLADFEALMDVPDDELYTWIAGRALPPERHRTPVLARIIAFRRESATDTP